MKLSKNMRFLLQLIMAVTLLMSSTSQAQIQVEMEMSRGLYMLHEALLSKITITNLSGRDLNLSDVPGHPWLSFEVFAGTSTLIPPSNPNYKLGDLYIATGKSVQRTINITPLYSLQEFGAHSIRALVYDSTLSKYFMSPRRAFQITEGLLLWKQSVGVPEDNSTRTYSLLTHRLPNENQLYVRVMDDTGGRIMACYSIGRVLSFSPPEHHLDAKNNLHVLQMVGPKTYLYSAISPNGEILQRDPYIDGKSNPHLVKNESGDVRVRGGKVDLPVPPDLKKNTPRLSDRPVGI